LGLSGLKLDRFKGKYMRTISLIIISFLFIGCFDKPKITEITLKKYPMIEVCFNEPVRNYYGTFIIKTKNGQTFHGNDEIIIDTEWGDDSNDKCIEFNPYNYLTNRWTSYEEYNNLDKSLKWSNIKLIAFFIYKNKDDLEPIDDLTKKF
jgi:hypothetical protein